MIWKDLIRGAILGFVIPAMIIVGVVALPDSQLPSEQVEVPTTHPSSDFTQSTAITTPTAPNVTTEATEPSTEQPKPTIPEPSRMIWVFMDGQRVEMELESYVTGVVLAEMPASFSMETLKAQAVAARTFAMYVCQIGRHDGAVCTDYCCCQAYLPQEQYLQYYGGQQDLQKIHSAVQATAGEVLTYGGEVICATYFSCSGGSTEAAIAVWGWEVEYLQTVDSPGEEFASVYSSTIVLSPEELEAALCLDLDGEPQSWFETISYTDGGGVDTVQICGIPYRGTTFRTLLGLPSTMFEITVQEQQICITTFGYGHRVGLSQYGAEAMALSGYGYWDILSHYYRNVALDICSFEW